MRPLIASLLLSLWSCADAVEPAPENVYQPLSWAEVESALPRPEGGRAFERRQLDAVLGTGFCLEGDAARERLMRSLTDAGWRVTSAEAVGDSDARVDVTAERGALVLAGSLTAEPSPGCARGFVYTVRKAVQP